MKLINQQVLELPEFNTLMKLIKRKNISKVISYQKFSKLVKLIVEEIMAITLQRIGYPDEPFLCEIKIMPLSRRGSFNWVKNRLILNEDVIYNLYHGNFLELLTIFHELNHFVLKYELIMGKTSHYSVRVLKEMLLNLLGQVEYTNSENVREDINLILNNSFKTYYKDNYELNSGEKIVNIKAIKDFKYVINYFKIRLSKYQLAVLQSELEQERKNYQNYIRDVRYNHNFNASFIDFEKAFDIMINSYPEWLKFSQLQIEYCLDEFGNVRKRTKEELFQLLSKEIDLEKQKYIKKILKSDINKRLDKSFFI